MTHETNGFLLIFAMIILLAFLGGCMEATKRAAGIEPVCSALIGPIKYNSTNGKSRRHAGPDLAVDLHKRNQVGTNLRCPTFR